MMPPSGNPYRRGVKILWSLLKYALFLAICLFAAYFLLKPLNLAFFRWPAILAVALLMEFIGIYIFGRFVGFPDDEDDDQ